MPVQLTNPSERAFRTSLAKGKVRLRNPTTGEYLHCSGRGPTKTTALSWLGHHYQADELRRQAAAKGEDWPYSMIPRDLWGPETSAAPNEVAETPIAREAQS